MQQSKYFDERGRDSAEKATEMFGTSFLTAPQGAQDFGLKAIELARQNANATFDFAVQMLGVRSFSQAVTLQRGFARKHFEAIAKQALSGNQVLSGDVSAVVPDDHNSLTKLGRDVETIEVLKPPVSIKKSLTPDYLISLEDGKQYKSLKRHLSSKGLTPAQYREKWGLPDDYPMVAPSYAAARAELAKRMSLRRKAAEVSKAAEVNPTRTSGHGRKAAEVKPATKAGRARKASEVKPTRTSGRGRKAAEVKQTRKAGRARKAA